MSLLESFAGALESIGKLVEHPAAAKGTQATPPGLHELFFPGTKEGGTLAPQAAAARALFGDAGVGREWAALPTAASHAPVSPILAHRADAAAAPEASVESTSRPSRPTKPGAPRSQPECPMSNDSLCSQAATSVPSPILAQSEPLRAHVPSGVLENLAHTAALGLLTQFQPEERSTGPGSPVVAGANHMQQPSDDRQMSQRIFFEENDWQFDSPPPKAAVRKLATSEASSSVHPTSQGACNQDKTVASVVAKLEVAQRKMERMYSRLHAIERALTDPRVDRTDAQIVHLVAIYQDISLESSKVHAEWRATIDYSPSPLQSQ